MSKKRALNWESKMGFELGIEMLVWKRFFKPVVKKRMIRNKGRRIAETKKRYLLLKFLGILCLISSMWKGEIGGGEAWFWWIRFCWSSSSSEDRESLSIMRS